MKKNYKAVCSLTWVLESDEEKKVLEEKINKFLKEQINFDFEEFNIHLALMPLKKSNQIHHLKRYPVDEILPLTNLGSKTEIFHVGNSAYEVKMKSDRFDVFKNNRNCVFCGIEGKYMILDKESGEAKKPHFNMYAEENGELILMTKDHIVPKSKNGKNTVDNYQTTCRICNNIKGNDENLTPETILKIRGLLSEKYKFTRKEMQKAINELKKLAMIE